jgi:hypothetical protein
MILMEVISYQVNSRQLTESAIVVENNYTIYVVLPNEFESVVNEKTIYVLKPSLNAFTEKSVLW